MISLKRFSLADWLKQVGSACRRFPLALLLLVFLTGYLMFLIHNNGNHVDGKWAFFFIFYPATGSLLAVSLQLLTEDFKHRWVAFLTQVCVHALWLGVSLYLTQFERFSVQQMVGVSATVVTMVLSLFLLCFYRKDDDVPFWNFAQRLLVALVSGLMVGGILTLGIILFVQSLDWLFGMEVNGWFPYIPTFCLVLLAPLLAMSQIPEGKHKRVHYIAPYTGFIKGVVQYLFIPLLLLYMATLYVYAAKILFTWQLPVGWVCYLVSASMLGMVILIFITYPLQHEQGNSIFKTLTRLLPLAMLPLLVLMSVAIGRRLSDYGITLSRLYVVVFNLWCYAVCIGLLLCRNRRIWWVPASFAVVLLLISVGPWSIPNVTEQRLQDEVREAFASSGLKQLPLSGDQYDNWLKTADDKVTKSIDAKLHYLQVDYGFDSILGLVGKDAIVGTHSSSDDGEVQAVSLPEYRNDKLIKGVAAPQGYASMNAVSCYCDNAKINGGKLTIVVDEDGLPDKCQFEIAVKDLAERDLDSNRNGKVKPLVVDNGKDLLMIDEFYMRMLSRDECFFRCSGVLFTK